MFDQIGKQTLYIDIYEINSIWNFITPTFSSCLFSFTYLTRDPSLKPSWFFDIYTICAVLNKNGKFKVQIWNPKCVQFIPK